MPSAKCAIRPAGPEDIPAINDIHKHYVLNTVITFTTEPNSDETTLATYETVKSAGLPYIVAVDPGNTKTILGFCYVSSFRGVKAGYRHTLELTLFCDRDQVRKGIGGALLERLVDILVQPGEWSDYIQGTRLVDYPPRQLMAVMSIDIDGPGRGLKLRDWYLQRGFTESGRLKEVGWKKERWIDTLYLQKDLRSCKACDVQNGFP